MPEVKIDILTEDEGLYLSQLQTIIHNAMEGFRDYSDVETHFVNVETAYHSLEIRLEKVYKNTPNQFLPDYSRLALDLNLWRSLIQSQLMSDDYKRIMSLSDEVRKIASGS